jgi:serine phosphatase RsbU (regulator of sigma subunit)
MTIDLLAKIPLFADLPQNDLEQILAALDVKEMQDQAILFHEGDPGEHFYMVAHGQLEVLMAEGKTEELLLNLLTVGEYLGEMSLILPGGHRTASVRSRGASTLLCMSRLQFLDLTKKYPELSRAMVRVLSQRLDAANTQTFHELTEKNKQLQTAYDALKAAQFQLIEKERLERELQVAADIQISILPDQLPAHPPFSFGARILPARQVGGDFYDVFPLAEGRVGVLIGDVADKGIPAAIFMARAHALIMAEADRGATAGEVLQMVNRHITRLQKSTQFVTVLYGILNLETRIFQYARAGHETPILLYPEGSVERVSHSSGMALGLWNPITLDERTLTLSPGSTLLLYTDGLTDCRNRQGESFGVDRIKTTLSGLSALNAQQVCDHLLETLITYQGGSNQDDDVTLVSIRA